jgi:hypothetical protein
LEFTVKGKQYFLAFVPNQGRWFLFTPAAQGFQRIPVVDDDRVFLGSTAQVHTAGTARGSTK